MGADKMCIQCEHLKEHCLSQGCWGRRYVCSLNPTWSLIGKPMVHYCGHWEKSQVVIHAETQAILSVKMEGLKRQLAFDHKANPIYATIFCPSFPENEENEEKETLWRKHFKNIRFNRRY